MKNQTPEKILVKKTIHQLARSTYRDPYKWKDLKVLNLEDEDIIRVGYVPEWDNGSDNSGGDQYELEVTRMVLETDKQFKDRMENIEFEKKWAKERRYESYLRLKEEFEPQQITKCDEECSK